MQLRIMSNKIQWHPQEGDIVRLRKRYHDTAVTAVVIHVEQQNSADELWGWTTFDIQILTDKGVIAHITPGCIDCVLDSA